MSGLEVTIGVKTLGSFGATLLVAGIWLGTLQTAVWAEQEKTETLAEQATAVAKEQVEQGKNIAAIQATLDERTKAILRALDRIEKNGKTQ